MLFRPEINWYYLAFFVLGLLGASAIGCAIARYKQILHGGALYSGPEKRHSIAQQQMNISGIISILYTLGFFVLAGLLYFKEIPPANKDALLYMFGILSGIELSIIAFYFGGSQALDTQHKALMDKSKQSDDVVQAIATQAAKASAASIPPTVEASTGSGNITVETKP